MARVIPRSVAGVVEQLALDGDLVVTSDRLAAVMHRVGIDGDEAATRRLAYELQRDGWLGQLRTPEGKSPDVVEFRGQG